VYFVYPGLDSITACNPDSIVIIVSDPDTNLVASSVLISIDDWWRDTSSAELYCHDDTVFVFRAPFAGFWTSGDTVRVEVIRALDVFGYDYEPRLARWEFIIDYEPPVALRYWPPIDTTFRGMLPDSALITLFDAVSGVDPSGTYVTINGAVYPHGGRYIWETGYYDSLYVINIPLSMEPCLGTGESCLVEICIVNVHDRPDYCAPNDITYCWHFRLLREGPSPVIIYPLPNTFVACTDFIIMMSISPSLSPVDPLSVRFSVNGVSYTTDDSGLYFRHPDSLIFNPGASFWSDADTYYVVLDSVSDIYGTPAPVMPVTWRFFTDFSAPSFSLELPRMEGLSLMPRLICP
jgi:hypothetical protein